MALIIWNTDYSVGVDSLDSDHIVIASLINHIHDAKQVGVDEAAIERIIRVLLEQAHGHFRREEALLEKKSYPDLEEHKKHHRLVAEQLAELRDDYQSERNPETIDEIMELLSFWLDEHILTVDMKYRPYMASG